VVIAPTEVDDAEKGSFASDTIALWMADKRPMTVKRSLTKRLARKNAIIIGAPEKEDALADMTEYRVS